MRRVTTGSTEYDENVMVFDWSLGEVSLHVRVVGNDKRRREDGDGGHYHRHHQRRENLGIWK